MTFGPRMAEGGDPKYVRAHAIEAGNVEDER
jgi:hypothetical protein